MATASTSSNGFVDPDEDRPTRPNSTPTTPNPNVHGDGVHEGRVSHAGTAMEGGSKVACDPRDLVGAGNGGSDDSKVPKLTLLEDILLLGIKDRAVSFRFGVRSVPLPGPSRLATQLAPLDAPCYTSVHWESYNLADVDALGASLPDIAWNTELTEREQGYLSFWNDNISYALRGCIIIELALRRRIAVVKDPARRRLPLAERFV